MSWTRQTVVLGPSFTGLGKRPCRTPSHQVERLTGIGPRGAIMSFSRTNPSCGMLAGVSAPADLSIVNPFTLQGLWIIERQLGALSRKDRCRKRQLEMQPAIGKDTSLARAGVLTLSEPRYPCRGMRGSPNNPKQCLQAEGAHASDTSRSHPNPTAEVWPISAFVRQSFQRSAQVST